ncbi:MAG: CHAT domain-containing protein [Blastocatellia bacterium]
MTQQPICKAFKQVLGSVIALVAIVLALPVIESSAHTSAVNLHNAQSSSSQAQSKEIAKANEEAQKLEKESREKFQKGRYEEALSLASNALKIKEEKLGANHPALANTLNLLATLYTIAEGDYVKAKSLLERALSLKSTRLEQAYTLRALAMLYFSMGDYELAEIGYRQALAVFEKGLEVWKAANDPNRKKMVAQLDQVVASTLDNLGALYLSKDNCSPKGACTRAEQLLNQALQLQEKAHGSKHPAVAGTLYNLATLYMAKGDQKQAELSYRRTLKMFEDALRPRTPIVIAPPTDFDDPGSWIISGGITLGSVALSEIAVFRTSHPFITDTLNSLAMLCIDQEKFGEAEKYLKRALEIEKKALGVNHPDYARTLDNYALLSLADKNINQALEYHQQASEIIEFNLNHNLITGSERQKLAYLRRFSGAADLAISLHLQHAPGNAKALDSALTRLLRHKALLLDAMINPLAQLYSRANPDDKKLLDQLTEARSDFSNLMLRGWYGKEDKRYESQVEQLKARMERIEAEISKRGVGQQAPITLNTIQPTIPQDAVLVEFVNYTPSGAATHKDGPRRYAAYLLWREGQPRWVDLGAAQEIDRAIVNWRQSLRCPNSADVKQLARALDEKVMRPVRKLLSEKRQIFISPDGALSLIPFAALVDESDRYLVERYSFTYLTSGRDLLRLQDRTQSRQETLSEWASLKAMIVANPDFGASADCERLVRDTQPKVSNKCEPNEFDLTVLPRAIFCPLKGTAEEAQILKDIFPHSATLTQVQATEAAVKRIAGPNILHIATHGIFLRKDAENNPTMAQGQRLLLQQSLIGAPVAPAPSVDEPLLRSMLALAGANLRKSGNDDGILTALEAAGLNLWGTKLVVLSACDTGVGEIVNGQGVYGLRRALALAGSESQVMSLWPVSDQGTRDLMIRYYKALQTGQGRGEGLRQVQLKMLADPNWRHPYYWAGFIQSGKWASLYAKP